MTEKIDLSTVTVENNEARSRFQAVVGQYTAFINYVRMGNTIVFTHTEVPVELEGQGIAGKMAKTALDDAKVNGYLVVPNCPYVRGYIEKHPEYKPLTGA